MFPITGNIPNMLTYRKYFKCNIGGQNDTQTSQISSESSDRNCPEHRGVRVRLFSVYENVHGWMRACMIIYMCAWMDVLKKIIINTFICNSTALDSHIQNIQSLY